MFNYKQLYYFYNVAKHGGVTRAAEQVHITPQTISGQVSELEDYFGTPLFERKGRRLELTEQGKLAYAHAQEIFQVGKELDSLLKSHTDHEELTFRVGVADVVPKSIAYKLLATTQQMDEDVRLLCYEDKLENLFAELALHKLDLVISDRPIPAGSGIKAFNHLLGESPTAFYATKNLAKQYKKNFPRSLTCAPMLLPTSDSAIRNSLDRWLSQQDLYPHIKAEFDDTALMKAFGQEGVGLFPAPLVIADEAKRQHGVEVVGTAEDIKLKYFAISAERKLKHPALVKISEVAQHKIFAHVDN